MSNDRISSASPSNVSRASSLASAWYRLAVPSLQVDEQSLDDRERSRRGRVISVVALALLVTGLLSIPTAVFSAPGNFVLPIAIPSLTLGTLLIVLALPVNRAGHIEVAGIMLILAMNVALIGVIISQQAGLDPLLLTLYDILAISELIVVAVLPPATVFIIATLNSITVVVDVLAQPHAMMWDQMINTQRLALSVVLRPIALFYLVAIVAFLVARSMLDAIQRADRAEYIASLKEREAELRQQTMNGVEQILQTHRRIAQGDLAARAPIQQDNALWQISVALNALLARYQRGVYADQQTQTMAQQLSELRAALHDVEQRRPARWPLPAGTPVDGLVADLHRLLHTPPATTPWR